MSADRIKGGLEAFVRSLLHRVDYFALYPAKVVAQNADGTLELQPDDTRIPPHSQVPIRLGIPGATVKVVAGGRVLLGFAGGRPDAPIATLWEGTTVTEIAIAGTTVKLGAATLGVARTTDAVSAGATMATWIGAVSVYLNTLAPGTVVPPTDFGTITGGNPNVKA
jgi:hypothetical protein